MKRPALIIAACIALAILTYFGVQQDTVEEEGNVPVTSISFTSTDNITGTDNLTLKQFATIWEASEYIKATGIPNRLYDKDTHDCTAFARALDEHFRRDGIDGGMALIFIDKEDGRIVHRTNFVTIGNYTYRAEARTAVVTPYWHKNIKVRTD